MRAGTAMLLQEVHYVKITDDFDGYNQVLFPAVNPKTGRIDLRIGADDCLYKSTALPFSLSRKRMASRASTQADEGGGLQNL